LKTEEKINAGIAQLETGVTTIPVSHYPDNPDAYQWLHKTGEVLVRYDGSNYANPQSDNATAQAQTVMVETEIVTRNLKSGMGAYAYMDLVRTTLTGYQMSGHSKFYPIREGFINEIGGIWRHYVRFACKTLYKGT